MRISYRQKLLTTFAAVAALAMAGPAAVAAQELGTSSSPTKAQYGDESRAFAGGGDTPDSNTPDSGSTDPSSSRAIASLPFTGADLIALALGAGVLLAAGLVLRRQARARG